MFDELNKKIKELTKAEKICWIVLAAGLVLKIVYACIVPYYYSPHDLGSVAMQPADFYGDSFGLGHLSYIQYMYWSKTLPFFYYGQYYHPPLFYIIASFFYGTFKPDIGDAQTITLAFEYVQIINMIFSWVSTVFCYKILKKIKVRDGFLVAGTVFLSLCPIFYIIGGEMNNDSLVTLFILMTIYFTLKWTEQPTIKNIIVIALSIAFAMLSKTSGGIIAVSVAFVFLYELIKNKENYMQYIKQYFVFGVICVPLGLSWVIRQKIMFGLPFSHVNSLPVESSQYIGNVPLGKRFGLPTINQLLSYSIDFNKCVENNNNIWGQTFITMNFDEGIFNITNGFGQFCAIALLWISIIICLICLVCLVCNLISKKIKPEVKLMIAVNYFVFMISYVLFAIKYPQVCTLNFRYIVVSLPCLICAYGLFQSGREKNKGILDVIMYLFMGAGSVLSLIICMGYAV